MITKITEKLVKSLKFNSKKPNTCYTDSELASFRARPNKVGTVSFLAGTGENQITLGMWPVLSVPEAREKAEKHIAAAKRATGVLSDAKLAKSMSKLADQESGEFLIRYDIPFESARRNTYPFDKMEVGGCIEAKTEPGARKMRNAAYQFAKKINKGNKNPIAFALRKVDTNLFRLWRIK